MRCWILTNRCQWMRSRRVLVALAGIAPEDRTLAADVLAQALTPGRPPAPALDQQVG